MVTVSLDGLFPSIKGMILTVVRSSQAKKIVAFQTGTRGEIPCFHQCQCHCDFGELHLVFVKHLEQIGNVQFQIRLPIELKACYPILQPIDIVIEVIHKILRVNALAVLPQPDMKVRLSKVKDYQKYHHDIRVKY